jgi:hypothetical protein
MEKYSSAWAAFLDAQDPKNKEKSMKIPAPEHIAFFILWY